MIMRGMNRKEKNKRVIRCAFCWKADVEAEYMILGEAMNICSECVDRFHAIIVDMREKKSEKEAK